MSKHPNLRDTRPGVLLHSDCKDSKANPIVIGQTWKPSVWPEDVRYCPHGKVQVCYQPTGHLIGPGTLLWRDISPFLERRKLQHAIALLRKRREVRLFDAKKDGLPLEAVGYSCPLAPGATPIMKEPK